MKRVFLISCLIAVFAICNTATVNAQYVTGIGLRGGKFNSGVSFKYFFDANFHNGIEGLIARSKIGTDYGWVAKGFYVLQLPLMDARLQAPFDIVFGGGVHGGYYKSGYYYIENDQQVPYAMDVYTFGFDALIALEYKLPIANLTLTADCNPFIEVVNKGPENLDFGLSLRYVFR